MSEASIHIEMTRERLRKAMLPAPPAPRSAGRPAAATLFERAKDLPVIGVVLDALGAWWAHHPLRPMAHVAVEASGAVVQPLARRNPYVLVGGAAIVGAALMWSRPWRWLFGSALFAGLIPQMTTRLVAHLPIESWMTLLGTALANAQTGRAPTPQQPAAAAASPSAGRATQAAL